MIIFLQFQIVSSCKIYEYIRNRVEECFKFWFLIEVKIWIAVWHIDFAML